MIRLALPEDAVAIGQVHAQSWRVTYAGVMPPAVIGAIDVGKRVASWREQLLDTSAEAPTIFVVDDADDGVVGFVAAGPLRLEGVEGLAAAPLKNCQGEVYALYLLPAWQGRGLGAELWQRARLALERRGLRGCLVWVLKDNPSRGFYLHLGGQPWAQKVITVGVPLVEEALLWPA